MVRRCFRAQVALRSGRAERLRYGRGSPYIDLPLPCGGAIDICILPDAQAGILRTCHDRLVSRQTVTLNLSKAGDLWLGHSIVTSTLSFPYTPKLCLRIAGRGADSLAFAQLAMASGIQTELQLRDGVDIQDARRLGIDHLTIRGPAFYIGAVGSKATHARRCDNLRVNGGFNENQMRRIHGPVGLIPSMSDASMLAVSILAEIVKAYQREVKLSFNEAALPHVSRRIPS